MTINIANATYKATSSLTSRTFGARAADVFNVKDYGVVGNGSIDDSTAINNLIATMYAAGGGIIFFPPGNYFCGSQINLGGASIPGLGKFVGSGMGATQLFGTLDTDFLVSLPHQGNGVNDISDMTIVNFSSKIGTGALRYAQSNTRGFLHNLNLGGMTSLDVGWNVFNTTVIGVLAQGNGQGVNSPYGSIGLVNGGANVFGWRENGAHEIAISMNGSNTMTVSGVSAEICPIGVMLGQWIGFATNCTITGANGAKKLTVSGTLSPPAASTAHPILAGDLIITSGVDPRNNPAITIVSQDSSTAPGGAPEEQGVYSLSGADNVTLSVGQPITIRRPWNLGGFNLSNFEAEGCGIGIYCMSVGSGLISGCRLTGSIQQGGSNQYGQGTVPASSPQCGIYLDGVTNLLITGCTAESRTTKAGMQFNTGGLIKNVTMLSCASVPGLAAATDNKAFIDNGVGTTLVTNASTAGGNDTLHFAAGTIPGSVVAGVPVYDVTTPTGIQNYSRVLTVNNGAGTVQLNQAVGGGVGNGDTIKFCVQSGVAGNILTVQSTTGTIGKGAVVPAPGTRLNAQGGYGLTGAGIGTGASTPMVSDQIGGFVQGAGGGGYAQYILINADGSAVSLNVGPEVITFVVGKSWGVDNLTGLTGIEANSKASIQFMNCNIDNSLGMLFANLPGQAGVHVDEGVQEGMEFLITDCLAANCSGGVCDWGANVTGGGGALHRRVRYNGSDWTVIGK